MIPYQTKIKKLPGTSYNEPSARENPNKRNETFYRFAGLTKDKEIFYAQVKEDKKNGRKYFMSCFSPE
ncbi:MAG: hypothetical protein Q8N37_01955 [bacterium]|nr:hypothetical protein [bacterium]